jgi:hypothetical protein
MTTLPNNTLIWIDIVQRKPIIVSTFGPYTNFPDDQQLLRDRLHEMCDADPEHRISHSLIDAALTPRLKRLEKFHATTANHEWWYTVHVKRERNLRIANAIRDRSRNGTLELYRVQVTEFRKEDGTGFTIKVDGSIADEIRRRLDPEGLRLLVKDIVVTFSSKKEAIAFADERLYGKEEDDRIVMPLQCVEGLLAGMTHSLEGYILSIVTITRFNVAERRRQNMSGLIVRLRGDFSQVSGSI